MSVSDDKKLELSCDHYKDTCHALLGFRRERNRLLVYLLLTSVAMLFQVYSTKDFWDLVSSLITTKLGSAAHVDTSFLTSVLWFIMLALWLRYTQSVAHMERQYVYLHSLETELSVTFDGTSFAREGKAYLQGYPLLANWAWSLYNVALPILLVSITVVQVIQEWRRSEQVNLQLGCDTLMFGAIVVTTLLFLHHLFAKN